MDCQLYILSFQLSNGDVILFVASLKHIQIMCLVHHSIIPNLGHATIVFLFWNKCAVPMNYSSLVSAGGVVYIVKRGFLQHIGTEKTTRFFFEGGGEAVEISKNVCLP